MSDVLDLLRRALVHVSATAEANHMMDGFGPRHASSADVLVAEIRQELGEDVPVPEVGELMRPAWSPSR